MSFFFPYQIFYIHLIFKMKLIPFNYKNNTFYVYETKPR